ncbi:D-alanyl-D-alanine carboxypeptidase, partial [Mycobacterium tuberculosis]
MAFLRSVSCLAAAVFAVGTGIGLPTAAGEPNAAPAACPYKVSTPPAVDSSEV